MADQPEAQGKPTPKERAERVDVRLKIATAVLGLLTAVFALLTGLFVKKTDTASSKVDTTQEQIRVLASKNAELEAQIAQKDAKIGQLESDRAADPTDGPTATGSPVRRRGPEEVRLTGGSVTGTQIDLDSQARNWDVNNCASNCDLNFRGNRNGIEEDHGQIAEQPAGPDSCLAATTYGFTISPSAARAGLEVCVRTSEGRYAGMVVKEVKKSDSDHVELIVATVTVWEMPNR